MRKNQNLMSKKEKFMFFFFWHWNGTEPFLILKKPNFFKILKKKGSDKKMLNHFKMFF